MDWIHGFLIITAVHLLAAAVPGPDFVMVTQHTLSNGKRAGVLCSLGIALGLSVHITYSAFGLAAIIANSLTALWIIKILGGSYLIYMGIKGLMSKSHTLERSTEKKSEELSALKSISRGFLCNALNPKAPIYFVSLFTIILSPDMPLKVIAIYGIWLMTIQFVWFAFVATLLSTAPVSRYFNRFGKYMDKVLGGTMIVLGLKVITSKTA